MTANHTDRRTPDQSRIQWGYSDNNTPILWKYVAYDRWWQSAEEFRCARLPIQTLDLICKNRPTHRKAMRQEDFKRIALDLTGDRTQQRQPDFGVIGVG